MPIEYTLLKHKEFPEQDCHYCGVPLVDNSDLTVERGVVQSGWRKFFRRPYCAVICRYCRSISGWEKP